MLWLGYAALVITGVAGWLINLAGLPGLWLMVAAAAVYAWATSFQYIGLKTLAVLLGLGALAELVEFLAGSAGARKAGGSRRAAWGALIGGVAGALILSIPIPILGTILGACVGAFLGAQAAELSLGTELGRSMDIGGAAAKGKLYGILLKAVIGVVLLIVIAWRGLPVG